MSLIVEDIDSHTKCLTNGQTIIGEFLQDVDGYWVYYPANTGGAYNEYLLMRILSVLEDMNKETEEWFRKEQEKNT